MELLIYFALILVGAILAVCLAVGLYILKQGDAKFEILVNHRSRFQLAKLTDTNAVFTASIPFINKGKQDGTLMDVYPRHLLPCEQFDKVTVQSYLTNGDTDRSDGYWEAVIIPKGTGGSINLTVKFTAKEGDISAALSEMVDMPIDIVYQVVSRTPWYIAKNRLIMSKSEIKQELEEIKLEETL